MPKKSRKSNKKNSKTQKQKVYNMIGCSQQCTNCGPNCHCNPCRCAKGCSGNCYLGKPMKKRSKTMKHKGGSGCGSCGCPIAPMSWAQMQKFGGNKFPHSYANVLQGNSILGAEGQNGGSFYKPAPPMPGPFVGQSWSINNLPGSKGIDYDANYLSSYKNVVAQDPSYHQSMSDSGYNTLSSKVGGYTYGKKHGKNSKSSSSSSSSLSSKSLKKGGGLLPQDLVNFGRGISFNINSVYNTLNGYKAPVNPLPYKDQLRSN